jgi:hypothetical protein
VRSTSKGASVVLEGGAEVMATEVTALRSAED